MSHFSADPILDLLTPKTTRPKKPIKRLDQLEDVVEGPTPKEGEVLAYNAAEDKYYVKSNSLDGGTF